MFAESGPNISDKSLATQRSSKVVMTTEWGQPDTPFLHVIWLPPTKGANRSDISDHKGSEISEECCVGPGDGWGVDVAVEGAGVRPVQYVCLFVKN